MNGVWLRETQWVKLQRLKLGERCWKEIGRLAHEVRRGKKPQVTHYLNNLWAMPMHFGKIQESLWDSSGSPPVKCKYANGTWSHTRPSQCIHGHLCSQASHQKWNLFACGCSFGYITRSRTLCPHYSHSSVATERIQKQKGIQQISCGVIRMMLPWKATPRLPDELPTEHYEQELKPTQR